MITADAEAGKYLETGPEPEAEGELVGTTLEAVWKPNLRPDFKVSVCDSSDAISSAVLRELDESNRSVQKSAESTSI